MFPEEMTALLDQWQREAETSITPPARDAMLADGDLLSSTFSTPPRYTRDTSRRETLMRIAQLSQKHVEVLKTSRPSIVPDDTFDPRGLQRSWTSPSTNGCASLVVVS